MSSPFSIWTPSTVLREKELFLSVSLSLFFFPSICPFFSFFLFLLSVFLFPFLSPFLLFLLCLALSPLFLPLSLLPSLTLSKQLKVSISKKDKTKTCI
uniref:Uncharacterized protein n=1 Tax=Octopus bimaculoides TaxID=37653 RepID=A0A0L8H271_OCTBM